MVVVLGGLVEVTWVDVSPEKGFSQPRLAEVQYFLLPNY